MKKRIQSYSKMKYITFFGIFIGIFFPSTITAQKLVKSSLPTINSFTITQKTPNKLNGYKTNWIEFSWETKGSTNVRLYKNGVEKKGRTQRANGEIGWPLTMVKGYYKSQNKKAATYELVAENNVGKVSRKLYVKVNERIPPISKQPEILEFRAVQQTTQSQNEVKFYWKVKNALKVRLYDEKGEIEGRIELENNNYGWPLNMPGALTIGINKTKTYRLVATGRKGSVTKNIKVYVRDKKCKLTVSITGTNKKHTDGIRIYKEVKGKRNELLFTRPVNVLRKNKHISYSSTILLSSGRYYLTPYGNGKSKRGNFRVLHKPRGFSYSCKGGNTKNITINAIGHKY